MEYSFYGGTPGKNFEISAVFANKALMMEDLKQRWQSNIGVGELVLISYGLPAVDIETFKIDYTIAPNDTLEEISAQLERRIGGVPPTSHRYRVEYTDRQGDKTYYWYWYNGSSWARGIHDPSYANNQAIDKEIFGRSYNSTLWQKIYTESENNDVSEISGGEIEYVNADYGIGYRLIAVLTGNTPQIDLSHTVEDADVEPYATIDYSDLDYPGFNLHLPQAQLILAENIDYDTVNADVDPSFTFDNSNALNSDDTKRINRPHIVIRLPRSQILRVVEQAIAEAADYQPTVDLDNSDIDNPELTFHLPQAQRIQFDYSTDFEPLNADQVPEVDVDDTDITYPRLKMKMPVAQQLQILDKVVIPPAEDPSYEFTSEPPAGGAYDPDSTINKPTLQFHLPRAVKFRYGSLLGEKQAGAYTISNTPAIDDLAQGDYYINDGTGFIYLLTAIDEDNRTKTFVYQARLSAPQPNVITEGDVPYEDTGSGYEPKVPEVELEYDDPADQTGPILKFKLPTFPTIATEYDFVGSSDDGEVQGEITGDDEYTYTFTIPRGTRFFTGNEVDDYQLTAVIAGAKPGDLYLNNNWNDIYDGNIYEFNGTSWTLTGNIKGNIGLPIMTTIAKTIDRRTDSSLPDWDNATGIKAWLTANVSASEMPARNELIVLEHIDAYGDTRTYWCSYNGTEWLLSYMTGGIGGLVEGTYQPQGNDNKAYTITYINNLIVDGRMATSAEKSRKATYSAGQIEDFITWGTFDENGVHV